MATSDFPILFLPNIAEGIGYTSPSSGGGGGASPPPRDRLYHAQQLISRLEGAWREAESRQAAAHSTRNGVYLEFKGPPGRDLTLSGLEDRREGVRLLNVRTQAENDTTVQLATVYIPKTAGGLFLKKIKDYRDDDINIDNPEKRKPKNQALVANIEDIRIAMLKAFWTDNEAKLPKTEPQWIEVWIYADADNPDASITGFRRSLAELDIPEHKDRPILKFPERAVLLVYANHEQLLNLLDYADQLAELRSVQEPSTYFLDISNAEQSEWVGSLLNNTQFDDSSNVSVCILDNGVNSGHPMITPVLAVADMHAVDSTWGTHDHNGHGTKMAGIATYGDVQEAVLSTQPIHIRHRLESVKFMPPGKKGNDRNLWGAVTSQAISLAEIQSAFRRRVICMAVTSKETRDHGRPTSWSATLDQLAAGVDDDRRRLIIVSGGNLGETKEERQEWKIYPASNATNEIHDPAQSWNALSVGAYTNKTLITQRGTVGLTAIAPAGGLSPCSTTSVAWQQNMWPVKPDIVMEGGNLAFDLNKEPIEVDDLMLLTTSHNLLIRHFVPFNFTSAATAQASNLAARIYAEFPDIWPETLRGLLVHSARWTEAMETQYLRKKKNKVIKSSVRNLIRSCGYGVPQIDIALHCLKNRLTLVSQSQLHPYTRNEEGDYVTDEHHIYDLPWPIEELQKLGGTKVKLRVTLSYFIEPAPGNVGWRNRYRYASHGLRFELNSPNEERKEFVKRINMQARVKGEAWQKTKSPSDHWQIGQIRDTGSIHSDAWTGTAIELASSNLIAVIPTIGWWRERPNENRWNRMARYSLIVTIETPPTETDIYTRIAQQITTPIAAETATTIEVEIET